MEQQQQQQGWREVEDSQFAVFENPGDFVEGVVVAYDPVAGATTYDGDPCGHVILEDEQTRVTSIVTLDKKALGDKLAVARPVPGMRMRIQFAEWRESKNGQNYKVFRLWTQQAEGLAQQQPPAMQQWRQPAQPQPAQQPQQWQPPPQPQPAQPQPAQQPPPQQWQPPPQQPPAQQQPQQPAPPWAGEEPF